MLVGAAERRLPECLGENIGIYNPVATVKTLLMKESLTFKPRARLLLQLGDELIRNEGIALLELVKNAYDADATKVKVSMDKVQDKRYGMIIIEDNGEGMNLDLIKTVWMEPGSSKKLLDANKKRRTRTFNRAVLGEKGIGRFAVHKLGDHIEIITKKKNEDEVRIVIDWTVFTATNYLNNTPIEVEERVPEYFSKNESGTKITVKKLRRDWTRGMVRDVARSWNALCSPFKTPESFDIDLDIDIDNEKWLDGIMTLDKIHEYALFYFTCTMENDKIEKFEYVFTPYTSLTKLKRRKVTHMDSNIKKLLTLKDKDETIDLSGHRIGKVTFEGYIFDRDPRILSLGIDDRKGFREYLNNNGGVKVYRDGIRIYDYGEPGNDWLNLDIRRVNIPTQRISNNIIIAAVSIDREHSTDLKEKTNREGFIENEAYATFSSSILYALHVVETQRMADKNMLRTYYGPTQRAEPVPSKLNQLKETIREKIKDKELQKSIVWELDSIEHDYDTIREMLLRSAGAGLNLSAVVHEVEKIVSEIQKVVETDASSRVYILVTRLSEMIDGFTALIKKSSRGGKHKIEDIVNQAIFVSEYRLRAHRIKVIKDETALSKGIFVTCAENLIISSILNIIDNSIWWEKYANIKNKKIYITCLEDLQDHVAIVLADNGPGFAIPTGEITKPFVTGKPHGMGLGLYIVQQVMEAHGGRIEFPSPGDFDIPEEYRRGATVALLFKRRET